MNMADTESTEITVGDTPKSYLAMIAEAARDPAVNVEKMQALLTMQERVMDRNARQAFVEAFDAMSMELPIITKRGAIRNNSGQVQSRFAKWEDIHRILTPILQRHKFVLSFKIGQDPGKALSVCAVLTHAQGHSEESGFMPLPLDATGNKNGVQGTGSSLSYGKRYTTLAFLNIVTEGEDNDGRGDVATGDDASDAERLWVEEAKLAAKKGTDAYAAHFTKLPRAAKIYLTSSGEHEKLKTNAQAADHV